MYVHELSLRIRMILGLVGLVLISSSAVVFVKYGLGEFDSGIRLKAIFAESSQGLDDSSEVKMLGVTVGQVKGITLQPDGTATVTLKMRPSARIPDSVTATIEPLSVFGPKYIKLEPGEHVTSGPFLNDNDPITKTGTSVEFSTILTKAATLLEKIDVGDLVTIFRTFADSVAGLGPQIGRIIDNSGTLLDIAVKHIPDWQQFLTDLAALTGAFAAQTPALSATITNLNQILPEVAARGDKLTAALDAASRIAGQLNGYINENAEEFGSFVDSAANVLKVAYDQVPGFQDMIEMLDTFFGTLSDIIRLPAPTGELSGALHGSFYDLFCSNLELTILCKSAGQP